MPPTLLLAFNSECRAYGLSTVNAAWREFLPLGLDVKFKKLSAVPHFIWAIGTDLQVYVHVHSLDVPIRVCEASYENERWYPAGGWSQTLLLTDRPRFSSEDGLAEREISKIRLPSMAWQWDGEWQLDLNLGGEPLNHDGWSYAVDFPRQYHSKMSWSHCARRRKWIRFRKYSALNSWCAIGPLHKDATEEPFIDIAVGGTSVPSAESGIMVVWAVTTHRRVMFRLGVSTTLPEGQKWIHISTPIECEVCQVSVGNTGLVWASCKDGRALVRAGVTRDNLAGKSWLEVKPPANGLRITQVSVGHSSVWCITDDNHVWFRRGVHGSTSGISEDAAIGSGWVEMVGNISSISVAQNDQVFAVGNEDRSLYFRSGVSTADPTGKKWKLIQCQMQMSRNSSIMTLYSRQSSSGSPNRHRSLNSLKYRQQESTTSIQEDDEEQSRSAPVHNINKLELWPNTSADNSTQQQESLENVASSCPINNEVFEVSGKHLKNPRAWSPVTSVGSVVGIEAHPESDSTVFESESSNRDSGVFGEDDFAGSQYIECDITWTGVAAGAVTVDPLQLPNWFNLSSDDTGGMDTGTFTVLNSDGVSTKMQFSLSEITCVMTCSEPGHPRLAIHAPRLPVGLSPLRLQFSGDSDLEDWLSHLTSITCKINDVSGKPSTDSIWMTSHLGENFVFDPENLSKLQKSDNGYSIEMDVSATETPYLVKLPNGMPLGSSLKITGCVYDDADQIRFDLQGHATVRLRHKVENFRNMPLHINPRFNERCICLNSMDKSNWEKEIRESCVMFSPGKEFELIIKSEVGGFKIIIDGKDFTFWKHRQNPETIVSLHCSGRVKLFKILYETPELILSFNELFWRQMGGHLRKIETCSSGVTWGIGYDHQLWVYTGGWGGFLKGLEVSSAGINNMSDTSHYYIYENQRWNPISGFSTTSLPTDRHLWSDITGKHKRSKEYSKLLSVHWQFVSEWLVDFKIPNGCDRDGWQYAVDFPMTYHPNKQFTDYARRRRWYRKCRLNTRGPWQEVGQTRIADVSLQTVNGSSDEIIAWAVSSSGDVLMRKNVTKSTPTGNCWEHIPCDVAIVSIACCPNQRVWAVAKSGAVLYRLGISQENPIGETWKRIESLPNVHFKQISAGKLGVWVIDSSGRLGVRRDISGRIPEGRQWEMLPNITNDPPNFEGDGNIGFKHIAVGNIVVGLSNSGYICKRNGITCDNPAGTGWTLGILGPWQHVTVNSYS
ncbi:CLUMA_CG009127, isoform A [Clunio marinus]|uniref:CLUMA_CG009127, isoform A n=1 Tax=Clunio marinus TaxID=568069 RepID=A0A1J1I5U8_9DIPT|nr:CLUMA_CG009127, isoform A [Clunio marinus]